MEKNLKNTKNMATQYRNNKQKGNMKININKT